MKKRILLMSLLITLTGLTLFAVCSAAVFHNKLIDSSLNYLRVYMLSFEKNEEKFLKFDLAAAKALSAETGGARVTFMDYSGNVLSDSETETVANHLGRKEVKAALSGAGEGFSSRYSETVSQDLIYYCKRYDDHNVLIRLAVPVSSAGDVLLSQLPLLIVFFMADAALCILLSLSLVRFVLKPVEKFGKAALTSDKPVRAPFTELTTLANVITDLKEAEKAKVEQIREDRDRETLVLDNMESGLIILDKDYKPTLINKTAVSILKYDSSLTYVNYLMSDREICGIIESGGSGSVKRKIGQKIYFFKISAADGGKIVLITDITAAERAAKSKDEFIANVTHEMNTPLTSINGFAELLSAGSLKGEKAKNAGAIIVKESNRLQGLVKSILTYSAIESDDVKAYPVDLSAAAKNVCVKMRAAAGMKNIEITEKIEDGVFVRSSLERITQLLDNLVSNAVRYNKDGGSVSVEVKIENKRAVLTVADTGVGIEKENIEKVFDRFYTVDPSHSGKNGGYGLGLAIVKKMAKLSKWELLAESEKDVGSVFTVKF